MRILSNFKDYYDHAMAYGQDPSLLFDRKQEEFTAYFTGRVPLKSDIFASFKSAKLPEILKNLTSFSLDNYASRMLLNRSLNTGYIVLCGKLYPFVEYLQYNQLKHAYEREYFFEYETLAAFLKKENIAPYYIENNLKDFLSLTYRQDHKSKTKIDRDILLEDCVKNKTPLISLERAGGHSGFLMTLNPCLKSKGFQQVLQSHEVYQELEMFLGILKSQEPPVTVSNEDKIVAHGFDSKSFKHR